MNSILPFILTSIIIEMTPGPNMAYLAALSISDGRRAGFSAVAGVALGLLVVGTAAAFGIAALITNSHLAYQILRWCGVFYLLWLGWDGWRASNEMPSEKTNKHEQGMKFFWRGFVTNILNPKAAIFYIAILPSFVINSGNIAVQTLTLTAIYVFIATTIHVFIVSLAGLARIFLDDPRRIMITRRVMSLFLVGIALWFAIVTNGKIG